MKNLTDSFTLADGATIPKIGFGTWQIPEGDAAYDAVAAALEAGYRHIDTARAYGNETSVGRAIDASGIPREEIYLTTKLPAEVKTFEGAVESFEKSIAALDMDYVDLYLIHAPWPWDDYGSEHNAGNADAWRAMEEIHDAGRARALGVSNFEFEDIESLLATAKTRPVVNQIRFFIGNTQDELTDYCQTNGILVEGYSPLATGSILDNEEVAEVAGRYGKTVAQICVRYVLQNGVLPLPKTVTPSRMVENADVDFEISDEDMDILDCLSETV